MENVIRLIKELMKNLQEHDKKVGQLLANQKRTIKDIAKKVGATLPEQTAEWFDNTFHLNGAQKASRAIEFELRDTISFEVLNIDEKDEVYMIKGKRSNRNPNDPIKIKPGSSYKIEPDGSTPLSGMVTIYADRIVATPSFRCKRYKLVAKS